MKKIMLTAILVTCGLLAADAQVSFSLNISSQPAWGPVGYDRVDYYYLPDADAYYDVNNRMYVYMYGGRWTRGAYLPGRYRSMDMYSTHKVVINERDPWMHHDRYHRQYVSYAGRHDQRSIRDSREEKYWQNPGNPQYNNWKRGHDNGGRTNDNNRNDGRGHGNGNNRNEGRGHSNDDREHGNGGNNHGNGNGHGGRR